MSSIGTFGDLLRRGEDAALAGTPITPRWAQCRAALLLLRHACGDLDGIQVGDYATTFPDDFAALAPALAERFPSVHSYRTARREIPHLLSLIGMGLDDGWDSIRTLARVHCGERAFRTLVYLATPAREAGLKPSEVSPVWAFAQDARLRRSGRWCFRRSLRILDALFDVPEIAASGLLPTTRVGRPPAYERDGSVRDPLPPTLAALCAASTSPAERRFVGWLWTALRRANCPGLPLDPSADDLLAPAMLDRIEALRPDGIKESTFGTYRTGAVRVLRAHATHPCDARRFRNAFPPGGLPAHLSAICAQAANPGECSGLRGLWKAIRRAGGLGLGADPSADDLLAPATWARIAALPATDSGLAAGTLGTYRRAARRLLRRHATCVESPTSVVLPPGLSEIHAAVRSKDERTGVIAVGRAILRIEGAVTDDPSADELLAPEVWGQIAGLPPEALGLASSTWKTYSTAAARGLRRHASFPEERPATRRPSPQDRRRRGSMALPATLAAELDALLDLMGYAPNSQRALRSIVARRFTSAYGSGVATISAPSTTCCRSMVSGRLKPAPRQGSRRPWMASGPRCGWPRRRPGGSFKARWSPPASSRSTIQCRPCSRLPATPSLRHGI